MITFFVMLIDNGAVLLKDIINTFLLPAYQNNIFLGTYFKICLMLLIKIIICFSNN
jgi:hypothetical protein